MKNFKKVLALVLAIATLLSFATVASAKTADFADAKDVKNTEAVDVLSYIKVLEGYPADNTFKPAKNITREEAAKIIAIFANKSTDISSLYTSANPFADMKGRWGESYVAYGYRAGIIAGKNATSFVPKANVKGTEFLKMVLVVLGYDQNKEGLVGSSWAVNTLELAKAKKLLAGLGKDFDANAALTRDQAAQIMLNALKAEKVVYGQTITNLTWNAKTGYWMTTNTTANAVYVSPNGAVNNYEHKLLAADFNLTLTETQDKWGRPTHTWNKGTATIGEYVDSDKLVKSYYTAVTECDIANDVGFKTEKIYPIFVNGQTPVKYNVQATDTVAKLGAQGRLTEVYEDRIVMIDTFLAKVEKVTAATFDAAGHLKTPSQIELTVYDTNDNTTKVILTNGSTNYTYVKGDYVLVNAYTTRATETGSGYVIPTATAGAYAEIAGKAESFEGAQTVIWFNAGKHTVDGTAYDDALEFHLNKDTKKIAKMTWFKDLYGNLIGVTEIEATYAYGVITAIRNAGDFAAFGASKTYANVKYVDGTDNTVTVNSIKPLGFTNAQKPVAGTYNAALMTFTDTVNGTFSVSYDSAQNEKNDPKDIVDGHLFRIETLADGTVNLVEMAPNYTGAQTMIARGLLVVPATAGTTTTVKVDDATKFLLRSAEKVDGAYVYTAITGVKDFAKYSQVNQAVVDAVIDNGYASVVYIIGDSDAAKAKGFSYIVGSTYNAQLKTDADAIKYYEVILATKTEDGTANEVLKVKKTDGVEAANETLLQKLIASSNYGKLFYIETTGGYVSAVTQVAVVDGTPGKTWTTHAAGETAPYYHYHQYNDKVDTTYAVGYDNKTLKNAAYGNNILTLGAGNSFYVVNDTVVVGDRNVLTDKVIYVIGNEDGIASKVYVVDNDASQGSTVTDPWTIDADGSVAYNNTTHEIKVLKDTVTLGDLATKFGGTATAEYYTGTPAARVTLTSADSTQKNTTVADILNQTNATVTLVNGFGIKYTVSK